MIILMFFMTIITFIICLVLMTISFIVSLDREKCSPFECGFDPKSLSRIPFSLHFFLITMIFLIFDVEIALIFPLIVTFKISNLINWWKINLFFIIVLLLGLYHEWNQNMLNWSN
uniref:NADH-ubiquinone oxidoreductase chain 3 n=1 Tax=Tirumala limniace TaxID=551222 RepID=A0A1L5BWC0_TIRLI|nr:NADH dehydrogenase subunit 3 [Tirumala limniace]